MTPVDVVLIGAGQRGTEVYGWHALDQPDLMRFAAIAEPDADRRERFGRDHGIPPERRFTSWEDLLAAGRIAEGAIVATRDEQHEEPTVAALSCGYQVLVEKPLAPTPESCRRIVMASVEHGGGLHVAHVLRYTGFFARLHELLERGAIGEVVTVEHRENVAHWHMAHAWVRGNWRDPATVGPMILTKCCHDLDILHWNLGPVRRVSSTGSLFEFRPENAPPGSTSRCTHGCAVERECPYSAVGIYVDLEPFPTWQESGPDRIAPAAWPLTVLGSDLSRAGRQRAIEHGPYGRCVYRSDNGTVDHQVVNLELAGGAQAVLVMHGHSHEEGRTMRYDGTRGTIRGRFGHSDELTLHRHRGGATERIELEPVFGGHGGGDLGVVRAFAAQLREGVGLTTPAVEALESHLLAFAAEEARLSGAVVDVGEYRARFGVPLAPQRR